MVNRNKENQIGMENFQQIMILKNSDTTEIKSQTVNGNKMTNECDSGELNIIFSNTKN